VTERNIQRRPLTELQQAILDVVWARTSVTADQVREALAPTHPLKDSSVRTLLRRLEARGLLTHRVERQAYLYKAVVPARRLAARAVQQIIDRFCGGSVEQFLVGMVDERVLSADELERLARKVRKKK
jgi:predicted transcriptional regulator